MLLRPNRRWSELPRDLLGLVLRHAVTSANPLPFTGLCHWSDPDSCAYHRHDDLGQQYELPPSCSSCTQGSAAAEASQSAATASPASPQTHPCFRHRQQQQQHHQQQQQGHACRVSSTVLAMRLVCRTWCDVVGEGVRRVLVVDPAPLVIWAEHFPGLTHLALGPCADFSVQSPPPPPPPAPPPPRAQVPLKPRSELTPPQSQPRGQGDPSAWPGPVPGLQYVGGSGAPWLAADHQNGDNVGGTSMQQQQQLQQPQGCRSPNGSAMLPAGRPVSPQAASGSGTGNRPMLAHGGLVAAHFPANDARGDEAVAAQAAAVAAAAASPARLRSLRSASRRAADTAHGAKWTGPRVPATATLAQCPGLAGGQIAEGTYGTSGGGSRGKGKGAAGSTEGVRKGRKGASVGKKAGLSGRARKVDGAGGGSGAAETPCQAERSLAALKALRNLQVRPYVWLRPGPQSKCMLTCMPTRHVGTASGGRLPNARSNRIFPRWTSVYNGVHGMRMIEPYVAMYGNKGIVARGSVRTVPCLADPWSLGTLPLHGPQSVSLLPRAPSRHRSWTPLHTWTWRQPPPDWRSWW